MAENAAQTEPDSIEQPDENVPSAKKRKRWWKKILLALVVVAVLLIGALLILDAYGRKAVERALAEARTVDPLVTFEQIEAARREWPPGQNGADVIVAISDKLETMREEAYENEHLPILGDGEYPPLGHRWNEQTVKVVAAELEKYSDVIRKIDQLKQYEGGRFPLHIPENPLLADPLFPPIRSEIRHSIRLKGIQVLYRAMSGDTSYVVDDMDVLIKHGLLLADEPLLISALIRTAVEAFSVSILEDVCGLCVLQPDQLQAISRQLAKLDTKDRLRWAMLGERAYNLLMCWAVMEHPWCCGRDGNRLKEMFDSYINLRGLLTCDLAYGIELYNLAIQASRDTNKAMQIKKEAQEKLDHLPFYVTLSRIAFPPLHRSFELDARYVAVIRSARVALAAELFRIDTGAWPEQLEQLVPKYVEQIPTDPFDRKAMKYKRTDDAFIVYSIGDDEIDDGGDVGIKPRQCSHKSCGTPQKDWGFALLPPSKRGMAPTTQPQTRGAE